MTTIELNIINFYSQQKYDTAEFRVTPLLAETETSAGDEQSFIQIPIAVNGADFSSDSIKGIYQKSATFAKF